MSADPISFVASGQEVPEHPLSGYPGYWLVNF